MIRLTEQDALDLLPAVVDQEVNEDEKLAFLSFIKKNEKVRQQYESALRVKKLLSERFPKTNAPPHLKSKILYILSEDTPSADYRNMDLESIGEDQSNSEDLNGRGSSFTSLIRYLTATAVLLLILLLAIDLLDKSSAPEKSFEPFVIEYYAAENLYHPDRHFTGSHIAMESTREAEQFVTSRFGLNMIIPELKGVNFSGLMMTDFYKGLEVPLLEYQQPGLNEKIYIFAFRVSDLEKNQYLQRYALAVDKCKQQDDFYVLELEERHVVSWLWGDKWYTAVSGYNGYELASLIIPPKL